MFQQPNMQFYVKKQGDEHMPKGKNQKFKMCFLAQIMVRKTDETHFLTLREIIDELEKYDVIASDRKTLYNDLKDLEKLGIYVEGEPIGKSYHYHVVAHPFELAELKLLVDATQSSKFITAKKSTELIKKLKNLVSEHEAKTLQRQVFVANRIKTMNESIYYNVDTIHKAIAENRKIRFQYYSWNIKKEPELHHGGAIYHISPWGLSWNDENYYLIGYDSDAGKRKHYRVDKMLHLEVSKDNREGKELFQNLDMADYAKKSFGMFDGEEVNVKLLIENRMANVIVDRFGKDVTMMPADDSHVTVNVSVKLSNIFIGWIFSLGDGVKIIGPDSVVQAANKEVRRLMNQYEMK